MSPNSNCQGSETFKYCYADRTARAPVYALQAVLQRDLRGSCAQVCWRLLLESRSSHTQVPELLQHGLGAGLGRLQQRSRSPLMSV